MEKITINNFIEKLYYEKMPNNLEVYLIPLMNKSNYHISMVVKYGNSYTNFKVDNKEYQVPSGVAHFLEHKLFEREDLPNPFSFFSKSGSDVNASTSIMYTNYYCIGNSFYEYNLAYMLNWLQKVFIDDVKIEKEKGIITEEAKMHDDNPDRFLTEKVKYNTFLNDPYGFKVIGEYSDINSITTNDLQISFDSFYRPDNMFLVVVGNFEIEKTINIIKEELKNFKNPSTKIEKIKVAEPDEVRNSYEELKMNVPICKFAMNYKINKKLFKMDDYKLSIYAAMILTLIFGNTSEFKEEAYNKELFTDLYYFISLTDTHLIISLIATSSKSDKLIKEIEKVFHNIKIMPSDFERIKKAWIANEVKTIDSVGLMVGDIIDDIITFGKFKNNKIKDIKDLNFKELKVVFNHFEYNNRAIVKILPIK